MSVKAKAIITLVRVDDIDGIEIGSRNLIRNSDEVVTNSDASIKTYLLSEKLSEDETYACRLWGSLGEGKTGFSVYLDEETDKLVDLTDNGDGTFSAIFTGKSGEFDPSMLKICADPSTVTAESSIMKIKLEKGNVVTDWSPAPEDIQDDINESTEQIKTEMHSTIESTKQEIVMKVAEEYYTIDDSEKLVESISTQFTQTKDEFEMQFNTFKQSMDSLEESTETNFEEIRKYIRFVDGNIVLGRSDNNITLRIQNDRISFLENGSEVAYFANRKLYVTDGEFLSSLTLGNFGFVPRNNGHLSFKKIR